MLLFHARKNDQMLTYVLDNVFTHFTFFPSWTYCENVALLDKELKTYERLNMSIIISIALGTLWFSSSEYSMLSSVLTVSFMLFVAPSSSSL